MAPRTNYAFLNQIPDPATRRALKTILDRVGYLQTQADGIGAVTKPLSDALDAGNQKLTNVADPTADLHAVNYQTLKKYVDAAIGASTLKTNTPGPAPSPIPSPHPTPTPIPPSTLVCYVSLDGGQPLGVPAAPNKRWFRGNFCGIHVPGLQPVPGGSFDNTLVFTPFFDRYTITEQATIIAEYKARNYTHFVLSWPDSRDYEQTVAQYVATTGQIVANGLYPVHFLMSDEIDGFNPDVAACTDAVMAALLAAGPDYIPIACVGWEMDAMFDPGATIQAAIDHVTATLVPAGCNCYVHFQPGITSWQANGELGPAFWDLQVGKLTGILHQKVLAQDCGMYQARLDDLQERFGVGLNGWPANSGFGHPFDTVAYEYVANREFFEGMTETVGDATGYQAICSPGSVPVMGFCNGCITPAGGRV